MITGLHGLVMLFLRVRACESAANRLLVFMLLRRGSSARSLEGSSG